MGNTAQRGAPQSPSSSPGPETLTLGGTIGRGGYGQVYQGTLGQRPVAVKKYHDILVEAARENRQALELLQADFHRECQLLETAKHPNVVEFLGVRNHGPDDSAVLIMELMDKTLEQYLEENGGSLSEEKQAAICLEIISGLLFLHQHDPQILHRDLTAKNVLMNEDGSVVKISDFGQAKFRPSTIEYLTTQQPGTVLYMPPEALADKAHFTHKGDVFSLGVLMLHIATQERPSCRLVGIGTQKEVDRRAADLAKLADDHTLRPFIYRCLNDKAEERPSCEEVWKEINMFQTAALLRGDVDLQSEKLPDLPVPISHATAVVIGSKVYVSGGTCPDIDAALQVRVYSLDEETWSTLEKPAPQFDNEATAVDNQLVLLGGREALTAKITNVVFTWTGQDWVQDLPKMPTRAFRPGLVVSGGCVIVAGGIAEDDRTILNCVSILDTTARQWWTAAAVKLPRPMFGMSLTVSSGDLYMAGGAIEYHATTHMCTFSTKAWRLPRITLQHLLSSREHDGTGSIDQWEGIAPTMHKGSTFVQGAAHPLVVGGRDRSHAPTLDICVYSPHCKEWSMVGQLGAQRVSCAAVSLSRSTFLVFGGYTEPSNTSALIHSVEQMHV